MGTTVPATTGPATEAPPPYGFLVGNGTDDCLSRAKFSAWAKTVSLQVGNFVNGQPAPNATTPMDYIPIWNEMVKALNETLDSSRLVTCAWEETGEFLSMYNCKHPHMSGSAPCQNSSHKFVAVGSYSNLYNDTGSWHFYDQNPSGSNSMPPSLGKQS